MAGLYPSLEDMKVGQMQQVQSQHEEAHRASTQAIGYPAAPPAYGAVPPAYGAVDTAMVAIPSQLYPSLDDYMGLTPEFIEKNMAVVATDSQVATRTTNSGQMQVAPITGNDMGIRRAEIRQGVREVTLCKDGEGKIGLRVRAINKGVFVAFVYKESPAAMAGLRFGDQILQINGENVAGWSTDKTMDYLKKKCKPDKIIMAVRDRPFERTITMQKDSTGHIGFVFKDGRITAIVKDSSAARNGILTEHQLVEVNGQNVVGLKDKGIGEIIEVAPQTVTVTIIPTFLYEHMVKSMGNSLIKKFMDHSIPDV